MDSIDNKKSLGRSFNIPGKRKSLERSLEYVDNTRSLRTSLDSVDNRRGLDPGETQKRACFLWISDLA